MLVMNSWFRFRPYFWRVLVRYFPDRPMNGLPVLSSSEPGFCPISMILAFVGPSPGTAFLVPIHSLHFLHCFIWLFSWMIFIGVSLLLGDSSHTDLKNGLVIACLAFAQ